jgi:hypothetical protein
MSDRAEAPQRRLVLVVGIGRSGSSLFAGMLDRLGFHVPQPEVKADGTNPRGFSEPRWVVDFHTRLMRTRGVRRFDSRPAAWDVTADAVEDAATVAELRDWLAVQFVGTDNIVVKDPRNDWFLPLWLRCGDELGVQTSFAMMLRHPAEVVKSARDSYGTWQTDASRAASWLNATLHTEQATRGTHRAFVRYEDLLADWPQEIARVAELLDLPWLRDLTRAQHPRVDELVDPSLRRSAATWDELEVPAPLQVLLDQAWPPVSKLVDRDAGDEATRRELDELRDAYVGLYGDAEAIAQSSVLAAKPRRGDQGPLAGGPGGGAPVAVKRFVAGSLRALPPQHRDRARHAVTGSWLLAGGLATLPLRLALLVPPRYRERVPLPLVRAGLRLARSLRR